MSKHRRSLLVVQLPLKFRREKSQLALFTRGLNWENIIYCSSRSKLQQAKLILRACGRLLWLGGALLKIGNVVWNPSLTQWERGLCRHTWLLTQWTPTGPGQGSRQKSRPAGHVAFLRIARLSFTFSNVPVFSVNQNLVLKIIAFHWFRFTNRNHLTYISFR